MYTIFHEYDSVMHSDDGQLNFMEPENLIDQLQLREIGYGLVVWISVLPSRMLNSMERDHSWKKL